MARTSPRPGRPRPPERDKSGAPLRPARLATVLLFVRDFDAMLRFYRDILGLSVRYASPQFAELAAAGETTISLHAGLTGSPTRGKSVVVEFAVADLDQVIRQLHDRGIPVDPVREESFGRITSFWDPEGHRIGLEQPHGRSA